MEKRAGKKKLSKHLLEMKFMKRTKEKVVEEDEEDVRAKMFENEVTAAMKRGDRFRLESSYVPVEQLLFGRMAFKGMNAEIENMMMQQFDQEMESRKGETEVSDVEMANRYSGLVATVGSKFAKKRDNSEKSDSDRRRALLHMAGQSTNQHTTDLIENTEHFLSQVRDAEQNQEVHPEMAFLARKRKEKEDFLEQVRQSQECQENQGVHPEIAFLARKRKQKKEVLEEQTSDFLSKMRHETEENSCGSKKNKFKKPKEDD